MTTPDEQPIPYESQSESGSSRTCGAAALSMVYRSLGPSGAGAAAAGDVGQAAIWPLVSRPGRLGLSCATQLMVKDALGRGYPAVAIQAERPLQALRACQENGIRAILNHRLRPDGPAGHYTVLVGMDSDGVVVHDPETGPSQRIPYPRLLELWQPGGPGSEIIGNVVIGIASRPAPAGSCPACSLPLPPEHPCPQCKAAVPLAPAPLVGCVSRSCARRNWMRVCCPACDYTFPLGAAPAGGAPAAAPPLALDLGPLFAEIDRFQAFIRSQPQLAGRDDVAQQLALMDEKKVELRLAGHEDAARVQAEHSKLTARVSACEEEREKVRQAQEALATPAAPLDGDALAAEVLKDLGLGS